MAKSWEITLDIQGDWDSIILFLLIVNMFGARDFGNCFKKYMGKKDLRNIILILAVLLIQGM